MAVPSKPHQVLRIVPKTPAELQALGSLGFEDPDLDWWRPPSAVGQPAALHLTPGSAAERALSALGLADVSTQVADLGGDIAAEAARQAAAREASPVLNQTMFPEFYMNYEESMVWLLAQAAEHADIAELTQIGESYEGRAIYVLRVHGSGGAGQDKPELYMQSVIHAREWITAGTINWMLLTILRGYGVDERITRLVDQMDLSFNIVANPDGYEWTHSPAGRLWRKTRSANEGSACIGTDPNRNWPFGWGTGGSSSNPCTDTFMGARPRSEVEVGAVIDYIASRENNMQRGAFLDLHSFGEFYITPWGTQLALPEDYPAMAAACEATVDAIGEVNGRSWTFGSISSYFGIATGGSIDTTYGDHAIVHSYAAELRNRNSFVVPFEEVEDSGRENLAGVLALGEHILANPLRKKEQQPAR